MDNDALYSRHFPQIQGLLKDFSRQDQIQGLFKGRGQIQGLFKTCTNPEVYFMDYGQLGYKYDVGGGEKKNLNHSFCEMFNVTV